VGRGVDEEPISNSWHDEGCDSASTGASNDSWHQGSEIEESDGEELHYECEQCRLMPQDDAKCTIPKCEKCILEGEQQYGVVCMELQDGQSGSVGGTACAAISNLRTNFALCVHGHSHSGVRSLWPYRAAHRVAVLIAD
jgi:hypothetical protein